MNRLLLLSALITLLVSCGNNAEKPKESAAADSSSAKTEAPESYLPIKSLLQGEISNVETYAAGILRKASTNGKKDSAYIQLPRFKATAAEFLLKELDSGFFKNNFAETSFMDGGTGLLNFIYTSKDSSLALQKAVVYAQPTETSTVMDRVYLETSFVQGDTLVDKKLTWKMHKYFYILTVKQPKSGKTITTMEKLIWDPQHFGDE